jgi:hypothetical protein
MTITTNPRYELPYALHDGWGGREWFFTVSGKQYGAYETETEAREDMARIVNKMATEREGRL